MKKILFAASEAVPFIKTGGLNFMSNSLSKEFTKIDEAGKLALVAGSFARPSLK